MTPTQFRNALMRLGLHTQDQAARALGIGRRSVIRYSLERYRTKAPEPVVRLIETWLEHGVPAKYRYENAPGMRSGGVPFCQHNKYPTPASLGRRLAFA